MTATQYINAAEDLRENAEQWAAYESQGNCVILAGPGSGKTKTITIKIARLLAEEVKSPRRVACITYSNGCVSELRSRLRNLGIHDNSRILISTVHSFCLTELVIPFAQLAGLAVPSPLVIAPPSFANGLFAKAVFSVTDGKMKATSSLKTACDKLRRTIPDKDSREWNTWNSPRHTAIVEQFERELTDEGVIDFDGMVLAGLQLVEEHDWVRAAIKAKFPVIVIDEYQDLGLPLHRIVISLLVKAGVRIIAVGDPDQSIYGFTGAQPILLRALAGMQNVESITLHLNYRCANSIIQASRTLLDEPPEYRAHDARDGLITPHETGLDVRGQAEYALQEIVAPLLNANQDWSPGDIAFLYRTKNEGDVIAEAADAIGLRYFRLDNGAPVAKSRLSSWLVDLAKWCAGGWETGNVRLSDLMSTWRLLRKSLVNENSRIQARKIVINTIFGLRNGNMQLGEWLTAIRTAFLDEMIVQELTLADENDIIESLTNECSIRGRLADFTVDIFGNQGKSPDQINLITLHSSKGMEFHAVIMVGVEDGEFPSVYALRDEEQLQEAKRLFYVGITRAKNQVHFLYNQEESRFVTGIRDTA